MHQIRFRLGNLASRGKDMERVVGPTSIQRADLDPSRADGFEIIPLFVERPHLRYIPLRGRYDATRHSRCVPFPLPPSVFTKYSTFLGERFNVIAFRSRQLATANYGMESPLHRGCSAIRLFVRRESHTLLRSVRVRTRVAAGEGLFRLT